MRKSIISPFSSLRTKLAGALLSGTIVLCGCGVEDLSATDPSATDPSATDRGTANTNSAALNPAGPGSNPEVSFKKPELQSATVSRAIYFSTMEINDCNEFGTCDWRIVCQTRSGQKTTLVNNYSADTGDTISINKSILDTSGARFVGCWVYEFDGGIGAGWDLVGYSQITASRAGWYSLDMRNGEGDVAISLHFD